MRQVQATVLLAVEPLILDPPTRTPPFLGYLGYRLAVHRQRRQPDEILLSPVRRAFPTFQGVEQPATSLAILVEQLVHPAELLHPAITPGLLLVVVRARRTQRQVFAPQGGRAAFLEGHHIGPAQLLRQGEHRPAAIQAVQSEHDAELRIVLLDPWQQPVQRLQLAVLLHLVGAQPAAAPPTRLVPPFSPPRHPHTPPPQ